MRDPFCATTPHRRGCRRLSPAGAPPLQRAGPFDPAPAHERDPGFAGIVVTGFTAKRLRADDPSAIVWDEIVAFWLVLLMVTPVDFTGKLWAFVTFRFFDIVKPPPIRYLDRRFTGGFGIMLDDLVAAFFTLLVIALWRMTV